MIKLDIKPLSVNQAWKGRRFRSDKYRLYQAEMGIALKRARPKAPPEGDLVITIKFGFSSKLSDWDNPIKPTQDIICKHLDIDDRRIVKGVVCKELVDKGSEFIEFDLRAA